MMIRLIRRLFRSPGAERDPADWLDDPDSVVLLAMEKLIGRRA